MNRSLLVALALAPLLALEPRGEVEAGAPPAIQQATAPVVYEISFPNAPHHEAEIAATYSALPARPLELRMSRSSPGRYAVHEFAKNVYNVKAFDSRGRTLQVDQPNPHQWNVAGHDGTVRVTYTLFGDRADGTYAAIDRTHAHLNIPATFMFARGLHARPVRVTFKWTDPTWRVASQLQPTADSSATSATFTAPHFQYFMDSPTEISAHELITWRDSAGGVGATFRIALHHAGTDEDAAAYADGVKRIVHEMAGVFGEYPRFDFGTYTFLADYLPWVNGDGMEHRNSTVVSGSGSAPNSLGTASHELFHAWNVERLRPRDLEPFEFEDADMSRLLWLAEGFTNYYGALTLRRAGITDDAAFARAQGGAVNAVVNGNGRRFFSPIGMSMQAPFVDAATSIDPQNRQNTFISYYTWGQVVALGLDLSLRERAGGKTLDDFMRAMWQEFGRHQTAYAPAKPYTLADVRRVLARVAGDQAWADDFVRRYIAGRDVPDYARLLERGGFRLRKAAAGTAWMGNEIQGIRFDSTGATLVAGTLIGSPLYAAGLDRGDRIVSVDGRPVRAQSDIDALLRAHKPGDVVRIEFATRGETRTEALTLAESPALELVPFEQTGEAVTDAMRAFRAAWLGPRRGSR
ncbi:MAG TPA: PDZ domain-containing protein [Gemmatimonadaceae bacterium]|jgi:predicted metalloprotease with PDZ domain|nr:PDZ domain-containing protein [Gemmatimonadaceae bacterium]